MEGCASCHVSAVSLGQSSHRSVTMRRRSLVVLVAALLVGCTTEAPAPSDGYFLYSGRGAQAQAQRAAASHPAPALAAQSRIPEDAATPPLPEMPTNMIIRTATASV